jgi:hypothetical protein
MELNNDQLSYVRAMYLNGRGNIEITAILIEEDIRPAVLHEIELFVNILKQRDIKAFIETVKELK